MLIILSPAKTMDFGPQNVTGLSSQPVLLEETSLLIECLRELSPRALGGLMGIKAELAESTHGQFAGWRTPFDVSNAKQAILAFRGPAFTGLNADAFSEKDFDRAQGCLRILSGLHGVLRPLDLIQPYRLEMGTRLKTSRGKNLYEFWDTRIAEQLRVALDTMSEAVLVNLASNEYFKSVKPALLEARIVTASFKELRDGEFKMIGTFSKQARGQMTSWIIRHRPDAPEELKSFDETGYGFNAGLSSADEFVFTRKPQ